jgi:hypothetical protein
LLSLIFPLQSVEIWDALQLCELAQLEAQRAELSSLLAKVSVK